VSLAGISVDPIENNRAMVEKLLLPFPLLSDPEGRVIKEWDVWIDAEGGIAKPSIVAIRKDGSIGWAYIGRDFADRPTDDELLTQFAEDTEMARGDRPLPLEQLESYMRGAKFATLALSRRHREHDPDLADDATRYIEMAERYRQAAIETFRAKRKRSQ